MVAKKLSYAAFVTIIDQLTGLLSVGNLLTTKSRHSSFEFRGRKG